MKRDLKADLEQLKRTKKVFEPQQVTFETPEDEIVPAIDILDQQLYTLVGLGEFAVEYGEEWLERAIEAEALVRESVVVLERMKFLSEEGFMIDETDDYQLDVAIAKAKEALGDG